MASNTVQLNTYKAIFLAKEPTITVGATGKTFNGTTNISFSMDEIMGSSDSSKFYRGDKTWSNTLSDRIHLNGTRKLQWTNSDTDNNADGASWYGLGSFSVSEENTTRSWICLSNYWGLSFRARDNNHVKINGNVVLNAGNYTDYTVTKTGSGASGSWAISVTGSSASCTGNAATATASRYLTSPDTRNTNSAPTEYTATTTGVSFDFKQNSAIGLNTVSSQTYSGVMTYRPYASSTDWSGGPAHQIAFDAVGLYWRTGSSSWNRWYKIFSNERMPMNAGLTGIASYGNAYQYGSILYTNGLSMRDPYNTTNNDCAFIRHIETTANSGYLEIGVGDDGTEPIYVRQYNTSSAVVRTVTLLDGSGNTTIPGRLFVPTDSDVTTNSGTGSIVIGSTTGLSIGIDANEIMCRSSNAASTLYIQNEGGAVQIGAATSMSSTLSVTGKITGSGGYADKSNGTATFLNYGAAGLANSAITWLTCWNGYELRAISKAEVANAVDASHKWVRIGGDTMTGLLKITTNSTTLTIGAQNNGCCHIYIDQNVPFAFNRGFLMVNSGDIGTSTYPTGNIVVKASGRISGNGGALYLGNSNNASWVYLQDCCSQASGTPWKLTQAGVLTCTQVLMPTTTTSAATSQPMAISYGRVQCYGTLCINANTDNSGTEYVILTAGHGCSSSTSEGFWVGSSSAGCAYSISAPSFWISGAPGSNNCIQVGSGDANGNGGANWVLRSWYGIGIMSGCTSINNGVITAGVDARYGYIYSGRTYNAVWNDFAEFRESEVTEPGRVLISNGQGQMVLCDKRLVAGAKVISDTYGCSVGQSNTANTPLGVAGRVLVYTYQDRNNYKVGDAVCAAPNGTVDIMTREEIKEYPDRIIGIVDEIPTYKKWEQYRTCQNEDGESIQNKVSNTEVKGRIWIYVR